MGDIASSALDPQAGHYHKGIVQFLHYHTAPSGFMSRNLYTDSTYIHHHFYRLLFMTASIAAASILVVSATDNLSVFSTMSKIE